MNQKLIYEKLYENYHYTGHWYWQQFLMFGISICTNCANKNVVK